MEKIEKNLFRGQSVDLGWGRVFGGQVLGQAISAAEQTVPEDRAPHSIHCYFLRPGDVSAPIVYDVDRIRDGGSFTTRRVVAIQHGQAILNMAVSFQVHEDGLEHQDPMPEVPVPDELQTAQEHYRRFYDRIPEFIRDKAMTEGPFEVRPVTPVDDPVAPTPMAPTKRYWFRAAGALPDDPRVHRNLLAYLSDSDFLITALQPHGVTWLTPGLQTASLDHAMWFHRPFRVDDWLLYDIHSPVARGARGLVYGSFYNPAGELVASAVQEGLIRRHTPAR
ncbi:MAG: acyl-CoA thioesterase II [Myxococcales bacterium]|nr:acyl-CoA thioesterase II [Myxococcales bacterium]MCB9532719.1 acyl-CoA thioesterase II [Myxococcales bacterium]